MNKPTCHMYYYGRVLI